MTYELIEALKREFWPSYGEESTSEEAKDSTTTCDYCRKPITTRAYHIRDKLICSPCLNNRFDNYSKSTFTKITNKSIENIHNRV